MLCAMCAVMLTGCAAMNPPQVTQSPTLTSPSPQALNSPAPTAESMYKDGVYTAQASEAYAAQNGGWQEYVKVTVTGGQVTDTEYDADMDGKKKSETTADEYPMDPHPSKWIPEIERQLKAAGEKTQIDGVTGATQSSRMAERLYAAALNAARTGNTATVTLADDAENAAPDTAQTDSAQ